MEDRRLIRHFQQTHSGPGNTYFIIIYCLFPPTSPTHAQVIIEKVINVVGEDRI